MGGLSLLDLRPFLVSKIDHLGHLGLAMGKEGCSGSVSVRRHLWVWAGTQLKEAEGQVRWGLGLKAGALESALLQGTPILQVWFLAESRWEALHRLQAMGNEQGSFLIRVQVRSQRRSMSSRVPTSCPLPLHSRLPTPGLTSRLLVPKPLV